VEMKFEADYDPAAPTMNVAAMLEGSDPELKNEYVILTAHLDDVGIQGGSLIFPGANDNASGVAGILATAEALLANPVKPKQDVIFMAFSGEETGLEGAEYYAENPIVPIQQTAAQINIDCIAVGDSIEVKGGADFKALHSLAVQADKAYINLKNHRTGKAGGADAEPLFQKGVPVVYFVTRNSYTYLHLPSDKVDTFNWPTFEGTSKLLYLTTFGAAATDYDFR
ncbi:M20/M25/M40 family metallo-hydrolase, partial [bacterium]|nr:M20/M25/M40 family metallo-hydrolase [bacterium]